MFNGDIGTVAGIDLEEGVLAVSYERRDVTYEFGELDEVSLAYAVSIHKSQGSAYPAVVIPLATQHYLLLERNLLYTGVTRGRKLVVIVGQRKALAMARPYGTVGETADPACRAVIGATGLTSPFATLLTDDLHKHSLLAPAVKFAIENLFPRPEVQAAPSDGHDNLTPHDLPFHVGVRVVLTGVIMSILANRRMRGEPF